MIQINENQFLLTFIMLLLSTRFCISDKTSCMVDDLCLPDTGDPPVGSPTPDKPGTVLSGSMSSSLWGWNTHTHRTGVVSHLSLLLPCVCPQIMTQLPVLSPCSSVVNITVLTVARRVSTVSTRMRLSSLGAVCPEGRRTPWSIHLQSAASQSSSQKITDVL